MNVAMRVWIRIPEDMFQKIRIKKLRKDPDGDVFLIVFLKLQLLQVRYQNKLNINICNVSKIAEEIDEDEHLVFCAVKALHKIGLVTISDDGFVDAGAVGRVIDPRQRSSAAYKQWRNDVFVRDDYTCQLCAQRGVKLEAHHKKTWAEYPELRYEVSNGITLCYDCHKKLHRGKRR